MIKAITLALAFLIHCNVFAAANIEHYQVTVDVDDKAEQLAIKVALSLKESSEGDLALALHPKATQLVVTNQKENQQQKIDYQFTRGAKTKPNIYFDGQLLTVAQAEIKGNRVVEFSYQLPVTAVNYWQTDNLQSDFSLSDGFELGMYSSWLPLPLKNGDFSYALEVNVPENYVVLGNGDTKQVSKNQWQVSSTQGQFDIPLMVSPKLKTDTVQYKQLAIEVSHFGFHQQKVNDLGKDIVDILSLFESKFGVSDNAGKLQFVFVPRVSGSAYSRAGFAVIAGRSPEGKFATLAHEIAHFWWRGADSSNWQDWLNESFAEYSALMAFKEKFGNANYNKRLANYRKISKGRAAIWGVAREDDSATILLYRKGPIILSDLKMRIGEQQFYRYLADLSTLSNKETQAALTLLAKHTSKADADWLQLALQQ